MITHFPKEGPNTQLISQKNNAKFSQKHIQTSYILHKRHATKGLSMPFHTCLYLFIYIYEKVLCKEKGEFGACLVTISFFVYGFRRLSLFSLNYF